MNFSNTNPVQPIQEPSGPFDPVALFSFHEFQFSDAEMDSQGTKTPLPEIAFSADSVIGPEPFPIIGSGDLPTSLSSMQLPECNYSAGDSHHGRGDPPTLETLEIIPNPGLQFVPVALDGVETPIFGLPAGLGEEWARKLGEGAQSDPAPPPAPIRLSSPAPRARAGTLAKGGSRFVSPQHPRARRESPRQSPEVTSRPPNRTSRDRIEYFRSLPRVPEQSPTGVAYDPTHMQFAPPTPGTFSHEWGTRSESLEGQRVELGVEVQAPPAGLTLGSGPEEAENRVRGTPGEAQAPAGQNRCGPPTPDTV